MRQHAPQRRPGIRACTGVASVQRNDSGQGCLPCRAVPLHGESSRSALIQTDQFVIARVAIEYPPSKASALASECIWDSSPQAGGGESHYRDALPVARVPARGGSASVRAIDEDLTLWRTEISRPEFGPLGWRVERRVKYFMCRQIIETDVFWDESACSRLWALEEPPAIVLVRVRSAITVLWLPDFAHDIAVILVKCSVARFDMQH